MKGRRKYSRLIFAFLADIVKGAGQGHEAGHMIVVADRLLSPDLEHLLTFDVPSSCF